jgi:hyperosmotically inducible protein
MRFIRRLLLLVIIAVAGVAAYNYWSENGSRVRASAARSDAEAAKRRATQLANQAAARATSAASSLNDTIGDSALTAKIKSKMALDDHVKANAIHVETSGSVVTLTGTVASVDERQRAVRLARDTDGITQVIDRLRVTE